MAIEKRSYRNQGTTSYPMTVTAGADGSEYSSFGYDDVKVCCTAIAAGTAQVQVSPLFSGTTWINHGAAFAATGELVLSVPTCRVRVQLAGGATGTFYLLCEKR
jgi:hypothetical protein